MNFNQKLLDNIVKNEVRLLRESRTHYEKEILPILEDTRKSLVKELSRLETGITNRRINALLLEVEKIIESNFDLISDVNKRRISKSALMSNERIADLFNQKTGILKVLSFRQVEAIANGAVFGTATNKHTAGFWWKRQSKYLQKNYEKTVRGLVLANAEYKDIVEKIRGSAKKNFTDGIMKMTYQQAKTLARSSVINVANEANLQMYKANDDVLNSIEWISTLDNRTSEICMALDGKQWSLPDYEPIGHNFDFPGGTAHFGCRSTQIPVTKSFEDITGIKRKEIDEAGLRSSYTGQVPKSKDFGTFLREQPTDVQNEILGIQKAKLFRANEIKVEDLINQDFDTVPLSELDK